VRFAGLVFNANTGSIFGANQHTFPPSIVAHPQKPLAFAQAGIFHEVDTCIFDGESIKGMTMLPYTNIVERLRIDPGQRTLGELLQDREAALSEIRQLRRDIERLRNTKEGQREALATVLSKATEHEFQSGMLIRISEVCRLVGVCRSTIYRWVSEGSFPQPVRIGDRAVRWRIEDIEAWRNEL